MDRRVGDYLVKGAQKEDFGLLEFCQPKQSLFIADTRESYWLDLVIKNAVQEFPDWDLFVCAPRPVLDWLRPSFPRMKEIVADLPPRASPETFSAIMYSQEIWKVFDTEFVMIIQTDTVFAPYAKSRLPDLSKDFYGAACGHLAEDFVVNGGLSLRRVSAFAKATAMLTDADRALPEDVGFCGLMRRHPDLFRMPTMLECMRFAIESFGDPSRVVGIHGTDKHYAPPALLTATLGSEKKFVDCVVYDGEPILETRLKLLDSVVETFLIVEARFTHAGEPKDLAYDPEKFKQWAHKIRYLVIDEFPPMPPRFVFGRDMPWVKDNGEAWWREQYQRDYVTGFIPEGSRVIVSDIDEIPDPARLLDLPDLDTKAIHLEMAFLVHQPFWQKREPWAKAFVCSADYLKERKSPTRIRTERPEIVWPRAGWHCSSFFDVDRQIQKIRSFAHREFAGETDPEVIRQRFETGKDPYGRGPVYDCFHTTDHVWLMFV